MLEKSILLLILINFLLGPFNFSTNFQNLSGILLLEDLFISLIDISLSFIKSVLEFIGLIFILPQFFLEYVGNINNFLLVLLDLYLTLANQARMLLGFILKLVDHFHAFFNSIIDIIDRIGATLLITIYFLI